MNDRSNLFATGQQYLQSIVSELAAHGLGVSPALALTAGEGLLCYYDLHQRLIHLALPDRETTQGRLQMLLLRSLLACVSQAEVIEFLELVLHWLVTHEVAHHLRHQAGLLSVNVWQEEQIANHLAIALSKPRFSEAERLRCHTLLQRATSNLHHKLACAGSAVDSYHSLAHGLNFAGLIDHQTVREIQAIHNQIGLHSETILKNHLVAGPPDIGRRISRRHLIIEQSNAPTPQTIFRFLYYYFGWMDIALTSSECATLREFAAHYLNQDSPLAHAPGLAQKGSLP